MLIDADWSNIKMLQTTFTLGILKEKLQMVFTVSQYLNLQ